MAAKRKSQLAVPLEVWSQLGPVPVMLTTPVIDDDNPKETTLMGFYDPYDRRIVVNSKMSHMAQVQCAYHEAVHCWLLDAGLRLGDLEEPVVDVIASALVNVLRDAKTR